MACRVLICKCECQRIPFRSFLKFVSEKVVSHLSNIYKFTEQFGIIGHRMGRKVGDMLEVVTMACIHTDVASKARMVTEPKVEGFTGAKHRVEFAFYNESDAKRCIGLVECKKVGVEVTKHSKTKREPIRINLGADFIHTMRPKWVENPIQPKFTYSAIGKLTVDLDGNEFEFDVVDDDKIQIVITDDQKYSVIGPRDNIAAITRNIRTCHIFSVRGVDAEMIRIHIDTCLTGPQTIEKAKQIAWVALDVRKKECDRWGKEELSEEEKTFNSVLVIGEASHWEEKSRKVVRAALDYNLVVEDELVVELFKAFIDSFGKEEFEEFVTKDKYANDFTVMEIVDEVIANQNGKALTDLDSGIPHVITIRGDKLLVEPL